MLETILRRIQKEKVVMSTLIEVNMEVKPNKTE